MHHVAVNYNVYICALKFRAVFPFACLVAKARDVAVGFSLASVVHLTSRGIQFCLNVECVLAAVHQIYCSLSRTTCYCFILAAAQGFLYCFECVIIYLFTSIVSLKLTNLFGWLLFLNSLSA
jgi:hypothetical protein